MRLREAVMSAGGPTAVATRAGVPLSTLNGYLSGVDLKFGNAVALCQACGISLPWLATGSQSPAAMATSGDQPRLFSTINMDRFEGAMIEAVQKFAEAGKMPDARRLAQAAVVIYDLHTIRDEARERRV